MSRAAGPAPRSFWILYVIGCALCGVAGVLVQRQAPFPAAQLVWATGLALLAIAAVRSWQAAGAHTPPAARTLAATVLLLVLAAALYAPQLGSMPPEMHGDEGEEGMDAVALLETTPFNLFATGWYELPRFHVLRMAGGMRLFGINAVGLRSSSVLLGALTVVLLFAVGRALWGFEVGLLAALLLVSARFFVHLSRTGISYIDAPFFSVLAVWFFVRMLREPRLGAAVWCGIALGIGIQSYFAVRLVPVLLVLTWIVWAVGTPRAVLLERTRWLLAAGIAAIATVAPMIGYFWGHWDLFWARTRGTSIFAEDGFKHLSYGYHTTDLWRIVAIQVQHTLPLFNRSGDTSLQYGFGDGGLFEPVTAALFVLGLAGVLARPGATAAPAGAHLDDLPDRARRRAHHRRAVLPAPQRLRAVRGPDRRRGPAPRAGERPDRRRGTTRCGRHVADRRRDADGGRGQQRPELFLPLRAAPHSRPRRPTRGLDPGTRCREDHLHAGARVPHQARHRPLSRLRLRDAGRPRSRAVSAPGSIRPGHRVCSSPWRRTGHSWTRCSGSPDRCTSTSTATIPVPSASTRLFPRHRTHSECQDPPLGVCGRTRSCFDELSMSGRLPNTEAFRSP